MWTKVQNVGMICTKNKNNDKAHGPPCKISSHMSIILKIQMIFHYKELSMLWGWHGSHISEPRVMRILTNSITMKHIDNTWIDKFKDEVESFQLSIAMGGVNPYYFQNTNYFIWLAVVININIFPWLFMKNEVCWLL